MNNMAMLLRRELWEHKALYVTPLIFAAIMLFGFTVAFATIPFKDMSFDAVVAGLELTGMPGSLTGGFALLLFTATMLNLALGAVVFFYSIDALYAERKDRSILFWRSLPVSDLTTVISKLLTAVLVAPLVTMAIVIATHIIVLTLASVAILLGGGNPIELIWGPIPVVKIWVLLTYLFVTGSLWFAPIVAWLLLCSAFARRSVLVWVAVPVTLMIIIEGIVFRSGYVSQMIFGRFADAFHAGLALPDAVMGNEHALERMLMDGSFDLLQVMAPIKFLTAPGLWAGLAATALFIAGAVYCRRFRA